MKAIYSIVTASLLSIGSLAVAQGSTSKFKVCIKIDKNENGAITKVDSCYEGSSQQEIDDFLTRMGLNNEVSINSTSTNGPKKIIINKHIESDSSSSFSYSLDSSNISDANITVIVDENGNITTTNTQGANVIIKKMEGNEEDIDAEIKKITQDIQTSSSSNSKTVTVLVMKEILIDDVNSSSKLPSTISKTQGKSFEDLKVSPVPAKESINISYKGNSKDELIINLFDEQGKVVLKEKVIDSQDNLNKSLNINGIKPGVYYLQLIQGKKVDVKKIVIVE